MKIIQPNCRVQFAAEDIDFISSILSRSEGSDCVIKLLSDEDTRDLVLDDEALFKALLERDGCLRVSTRLYFYVLVRHALKEAQIPERQIADYVAELLVEFARTERARLMCSGQETSTEYLFEMLDALRRADDRTGFLIRAHIGNYALFLSGLFPDRIRFRAEARGSPDVKYYEGIGRTQYRLASDHRLAQRYDLCGIFTRLSDQFESARLALNDISDRLFSLGEPGDALDLALSKYRN